MAYGVKYRCEYTDIQGVDWKVDILEDSYAGAISAMIASGEPLSIEYMTPSDELTLTPIKGSMVTLNVECTTNFEYIGLYSEEDLLRPMNIYKNEVLYWSGWLSNEYTEPYDNVPYTVSITASDALGILKNIPYKNGTADYTGREIETDIILRILGKIGHTQFTEYCNLYEDRMDDAVDDSLFDQALADNDLFIDADCYSVLQAILSSYNAVIRNRAGTFIIYRPTELIGDTVYGRIITAASTTGTSITPDHVIDRDALELIDVEGGVLMYKPPMSKFTANQDYGSRESWLDNYDFDISTWQGYLAGQNRFTSWTNLYPVMPASFYTGLPDDINGVPLANTGVGAGSVYQIFGTYAKACSDTFIISFDYVLINASLSDISNAVVKINIADATNTYYLDSGSSDEYATWESSGNVGTTIATLPPGTGEWQHLSFSFSGLPVDGPYSLSLQSSNEDTIIGFRNVRFYSNSDEINTYTRIVRKWKKWVYAATPAGIIYFFGGGRRKIEERESIDNEEIVSREYVVDNAVYGEEGSQEYIIGDVENTGIVNVVEQFKGALAMNIAGSLTQTAVDFVNSHAASYLSYGTILTSEGNILRWTAEVPGTDFAGNTTITPVGASTLDGVVTNVTANAAGAEQIETITLSGGGAGTTADVTFYGTTYAVTYNTSLTQTAADFVTAWAADLASFNVTVTSDAEDIIFTETVMSGGFTAPTISTGTLTGTVYHTQAAAAPTARVDEIALEGDSGTATVVCDGVSTTATMNTDTVIEHTASWHTRGNTEGKPLAELIGDEVADMYSKGRQMVQLNMVELTESLDVLNNLQDPLNLVGANNRVFAFNRGGLNAQMREWTIDIIEIGDKASEPEEPEEPEVPPEGYYVATDGDDDGAGTYEDPWATWAHAFANTTAGDTVYFRGGVYYVTSMVYKNSNGGSEGNPINYFAYPYDWEDGNHPILDGTNKTSGSCAIATEGLSYINFKGLTVRNHEQKNDDDWDCSGFLIIGGSDINFELCVAENTGFRGFDLNEVTGECNIINCDSFDNVDHLTVASYPGNHGQGFCVTTATAETPVDNSTMYFFGCRAWGNSDGGFSSNYGNHQIFESCWAWDQGKEEGEGVGFKYGPGGYFADGVLSRYIHNCIAAYNISEGEEGTGDGFNSNDNDFDYFNYDVDNNIAYANGTGFIAYSSGTNAERTTRRIRNNISYDNAVSDVEWNWDNFPTDTYNSWNDPPDVTVTGADFADLPSSVAECNSVLGAARQADGSLPDIGDFFKLATGSDLIDAGTDVGLDYNGAAPDLGAFEYE